MSKLELASVLLALIAGSGASKRYRERTSGACSDDPGYAPIADPETCRAAVNARDAARSLAGFDRHALPVSVNTTDFPKGCQVFSSGCHYTVGCFGAVRVNLHPSPDAHCSAIAKCLCVSALPSCTDPSGISPHDDARSNTSMGCFCGQTAETPCLPTTDAVTYKVTQPFCNAEFGMCSDRPIPSCDHTNGTELHASSEQCVCGSNAAVCNRGTGLFCNVEAAAEGAGICADHPVPTCTNLNGTEENGGSCACGLLGCESAETTGSEVKVQFEVTGM